MGKKISTRVTAVTTYEKKRSEVRLAGRPRPPLGAAPRGWSKAPSIRRTRGGLTPSNDDPLSHRLRPGDGREKGLMDVWGWCALFLFVEVLD